MKGVGGTLKDDNSKGQRNPSKEERVLAGGKRKREVNRESVCPIASS